jgi:N-acylneuraminate cytidylyltransferase
VIRIAEDSGLFDMVAVSTDSDAVEWTVDEKALVIRRPPELCGDVGEARVLAHAMDCTGYVNGCRIYPFAALLTPGRLQYGFSAFNSNIELDGVMEAQEYSHPPQRSFDCLGKYVIPEIVDERTQSLERRYHDAGTYRFFRRSSLGEPLGVQYIKWMHVSPMEAQDVDDEEDWRLLEAKWLYQYLKSA